MPARPFNLLVCLVVLGSITLSCSDATSSDDNGGSGATGSTASGGTGSSASTGGTTGAGGLVAAGGVSDAGSTSSNGTATGGVTAAGGSGPVTGGTTGSGGESTSGGRAGSGGRTGSAGSSTNGGTAGGGGSTAPSGDGPCDIYAAANTPCVAAYSTVRVLSKAYTGPLYQVRKAGGAKNTGTGGTTQDIEAVDGFADTASQDAFCGDETCTFSKLYDQSGRGNDLTVAKKGCYSGTASEDDYESNAKKQSVTVGGHKVYALYMEKHEGYRKNDAQGTATKAEEQGVYDVAAGSGLRPGAGCCCCWNFGTASTDNCYGPTGMMAALFLGTGYWGSGAGDGPWYLGDFEAGVWAGGTGDSGYQNPDNPSMTMDFAFGILKAGGQKYALRMGDAQQGDLTTAYDGNIGNWTWQLEGGIILGIGGDNSNSSDGTFFEGAITFGWPSNDADAAVLKNVQAAGYQR